MRIRTYPLQAALPAAAVIIALCANTGAALALPAYAEQTSQPCISCHVGGLGPQLTPFGRQFKLEGYTMRAADGFVAPVSAMAVASYLQTAADQPAPPALHYGTNNNFTLDQASIFLASGTGDHFGGFAQFTYNGVDRSFSWDNLDLRAIDRAKLFGQSAIVGLLLNNNPGVQDPWNTLPAWGYPYTFSSLAPSPAAGTILDGALAQSVLGVSAYAWWHSSIYGEAGIYWTPGRGFLNALGVNPNDGAGVLAAPAPYLRAGYEFRGSEQNYHFGAVAFAASLYPGGDTSTGAVDRDTDLGADAGYQFTGTGNNVLSLNSIYIHEDQKLTASSLLGNSGSHDSLNEFRTDVSYYWNGWIGGTVQYFNIWGSRDPMLYAGNSTFRPNSNGVMFQIDATPFGNGSNFAGFRFNLRTGIQYLLYTEFDGAARDYDGTGRRAADDNTLRIFTWFTF